MNRTNTATKVAVEEAANKAPKRELSKHDKAAIEAAKINTKNDGSHIESQRKKLTANAAK